MEANSDAKIPFVIEKRRMVGLLSFNIECKLNLIDGRMLSLPQRLLQGGSL